ncbi:hypothetical protein B0H10DRAFT_2295429 [Mycena sp. CBHHK59/15]|nr:hypothetical protein B0H10DRAFT_2295429 [Mycena sp. CBHHK59/15]
MSRRVTRELFHQRRVTGTARTPPNRVPTQWHPVIRRPGLPMPGLPRERSKLHPSQVLPTQTPRNRTIVTGTAPRATRFLNSLIRSSILGLLMEARPNEVVRAFSSTTYLSHRRVPERVARQFDQ